MGDRLEQQQHQLSGWHRTREGRTEWGEKEGGKEGKKEERKNCDVSRFQDPQGQKYELELCSSLTLFPTRTFNKDCT